MGHTSFGIRTPAQALGTRLMRSHLSGSPDSHQSLLHSGYHLVPHHEPHMLHGYYSLLVVLVLVHVLAILYWAWLATKIYPPKVKRKVGKGAELRDYRCQPDGQRSSVKAHAALK